MVEYLGGKKFHRLTCAAVASHYRTMLKFRKLFRMSQSFTDVC